MKESTHLWDLLKKDNRLPGTFNRIENVAGSGMPDVNGTDQGQDYWMELKIFHSVKEAVDPLQAMRPSQIAWHSLRVRHNALVFVCGRHQDTIHLFRVARGLKEPVTYISLMSMSPKYPWEEFTSMIKKSIDTHRSTQYLCIKKVG